MRAAGRHTVPPLILKRVRRPPPDPDSTSQTRQPPSTMRPASLCRPGNRRPPCDQPHLADPAIAVHHATSPPCRPGNRRPPVMPPFLHTDPTAAARRRRSLVKQTVVPRSRPCRPPPQPKGIEGQPKGPAVGRGRGGKGLQREGVAEGRGRGGEGSQREGVAEGRGRGGKGLRKGGVQSEGPQPYPAWACGESGGVFSRALYHLQA